MVESSGATSLTKVADFYFVNYGGPSAVQINYGGAYAGANQFGGVDGDRRGADDGRL